MDRPAEKNNSIENSKTWDLSTPATVFTADKETNLVGALGVAIKTIDASKEEIVNGYGSTKTKFVKIPEGTVLMIMEQNSIKKRLKVAYEASAFWISAGDLVLLNVENNLKKAKFALTGELSKGRECYKSIIKMKGGALLSAVSRNCDYLIVGQRNSSHGPTTKLKKAKQFNITVISESKLIEMLLGQNK